MVMRGRLEKRRFPQYANERTTGESCRRRRACLPSIVRAIARVTPLSHLCFVSPYSLLPRPKTAQPHSGRLGVRPLSCFLSLLSPPTVPLRRPPWNTFSSAARPSSRLRLSFTTFHIYDPAFHITTTLRDTDTKTHARSVRPTPCCSARITLLLLPHQRTLTMTTSHPSITTTTS